MRFTYKDYLNLIDCLIDTGYSFTNYSEFSKLEKPVIFRHDIDMSLEKALTLARLESGKSISSIYFVLLATDFYNVFAKKSRDILREITTLGHFIGLHFDEKQYQICGDGDIERLVSREKEILSMALDLPINAVSMHRPSRWLLEQDLNFRNLVNTYSKLFLKDFKYLSDSRMHWREDVKEIVESKRYDRLHILTHPFWYGENDPGIKMCLQKFIRKATRERYDSVKDNIRDFAEILSWEEFK